MIPIEIKLLLLLYVANGAPIVCEKVFREKYSSPLDFGAVFFDGRRLLGQSKTLRGFVSALIASTAVAPLLGIDWYVGLVFGLLSMAGDLFSSFVKRRLGMKPSSRAIGLDQIPEALFPLAALRNQIGVDLSTTGIIVMTFLVTELVLSQLLFRLNIRRRPY